MDLTRLNHWSLKISSLWVRQIFNMRILMELQSKIVQLGIIDAIDGWVIESYIRYFGNFVAFRQNLQISVVDWRTHKTSFFNNCRQAQRSFRTQHKLHIILNECKKARHAVATIIYLRPEPSYLNNRIDGRIKNHNKNKFHLLKPDNQDLI